MHKTTRTTQALATLSGGAILSLALCFPAVAADGGGPADGVDVGAAKHGAIDAPPRVDVGRMLNDIDTPTARGEQAPASAPKPATVDEPVAYDQIALGALGGLALASISVAVLRHRGGHHTPRLT